MTDSSSVVSNSLSYTVIDYFIDTTTVDATVRIDIGQAQVTFRSDDDTIRITLPFDLLYDGAYPISIPKFWPDQFPDQLVIPMRYGAVSFQRYVGMSYMSAFWSGDASSFFFKAELTNEPIASAGTPRATFDQ